MPCGTVTTAPSASPLDLPHVEPALGRAKRGDRGRAVDEVVDEVPLVEPQAASAVPLAGQDVDVPIAVPVLRVRARDHLRRLARHNRHPVRVRGKRRLDIHAACADVAVEPDRVLELAADEVLLAVAVPVDHRYDPEPGVTERPARLRVQPALLLV